MAHSPDSLRTGSSPVVSAIAIVVAAVAGAILPGCDAQGELTIVLDDTMVSEARFLEIAVAGAADGDGVSCAELLERSAPYHDTRDPTSALNFSYRAGVPLEDGAPTGESGALLPLGALHDDDLIAARVRDSECDVIGVACTRLAVDELDARVRLELVPVEESFDCPDNYRCDGGAEGECLYGNCLVDPECHDEDVSTTQVCQDWFCATVEDQDRDGASFPEDCDDFDPLIPSTPLTPLCGAAVDYDCDGVIDDVDGCGVPACDQYELVDITNVSLPDTLLFGHTALDVVVSGRRVVVTLFPPPPDPQAVLWLGELSDDGSLSTGAVLTIDVPTGTMPVDLAVHRDTAFVVHRDGIEMIDLTDAGLPDSARLDRIKDDEGTVWQKAIVSPPLLYAPAVFSVKLFDVTWTDPTHDWPVFVRDRASLAFMGIVDAAVRRGMIYAIGSSAGEPGTNHVGCALATGGEVDPIEECLDLASDPYRVYLDHWTVLIQAMAVSYGEHLFFVAREDRPDENPDRSLLYRVRRVSDTQLEPEAIGADDEPYYLVLGPLGELGATNYLGVLGVDTDAATGLVLLRSTGDDAEHARLHLHPAADPTTWTTHDVGGVVEDAAIVGDRLVLAAGDAGVITARLVCGE